MAKFRRFDPRNKKAGRKKNDSKNGYNKVERKLTKHIHNKKRKHNEEI